MKMRANALSFLRVQDYEKDSTPESFLLNLQSE